ncbi:hypothetical protein L6452_22312 [Arctium lappa]|uniref:Uncharacterized protein n=1 Tax=Arctium lappa TaxID=4217 RepID=A0ACB9AZT3_ARCLA|nr:hypothetical protein L6452_22312 [Arctium lappa]
MPAEANQLKEACESFHFRRGMEEDVLGEKVRKTWLGLGLYRVWYHCYSIHANSDLQIACLISWVSMFNVVMEELRRELRQEFRDDIGELSKKLDPKGSQTTMKTCLLILITLDGKNNQTSLGNVNMKVTQVSLVF